MSWLVTLGWRNDSPDQAYEQERVRARLLDQERRLMALDRAVEVIQRTLAEEHRDAASNG